MDIKQPIKAIETFDNPTTFYIKHAQDKQYWECGKLVSKTYNKLINGVFTRKYKRELLTVKESLKDAEDWLNIQTKKG